MNRIGRDFARWNNRPYRPGEELIFYAVLLGLVILIGWGEAVGVLP